MQQIINKQTNHIKALDSLRGLAAISVCLLHLAYIIDPGETLLRPWFFYYTGHEAVIFFFVLSGYVLTRSHHNNNIPYFTYAVRRIFRIYPAYYLSTILGVFLFLLLQPVKIPAYSNWFNDQLPSVKLSISFFINSLLLVTNDTSKLNSVIWSLTYEVIISVLYLPLLWKCTLKQIYLLLALALITTILTNIFHINENILSKSIKFSIFFLFGIITYHNQHHLKILSKTIMLPFYIMIYASSFFTFGHFPHRLVDLAAGIGSVGFIILAIFNPYIKNLLNHRILLFYGKISFSFYLFHISIMYLVVYLLKDIMPLHLIKILIFLITTVISYLAYQYIEKPSIQICKKIFIKR